MTNPLKAAVGKGCPNQPADVKTVQVWLNQCPQLSGNPRLPEDGKADAATLARIVLYQQSILKLVPADGRIDPHGRTAKALLHSLPSARPPQVVSFLQMALPAARQVKLKWRVPVSICLAQAALESSWGRVAPGNAYFGVKGQAPTGDSTRFTTTEVLKGQAVKTGAKFRAYKDFAEAADDYGRVLATLPVFAPCFAFVNDPARFADALQATGYATNPKYAAELKAVIRDNALEQYDKP